MFPKDVRYTTTHEWVRLEDNVATVGITKYAADQLSDLTYVELPDVGEDLTAEMIMGTIESVKAAADLMSPIDGRVLEVNGAVAQSPELISEDPYDDGWLIKIKPTDASQLDEMMTSEAYQLFVQAEAGEEEEEKEEEKEEEMEEEKEEPVTEGAAPEEDEEEDEEEEEEEKEL